MPVQKPIVVVGSINQDLVAVAKRVPVVGETIIATGFETHPGGKGANQAVAVARLGYPVQMIGRLGNDAYGTELRRHLQSAGVDVSGIAASEGSSGVAVVIVAEGGDNCILVAPGANARVTPAYVDANLSLIQGAGMVLAQLEIPLETVEHLARVCAREEGPFMLDPAPATRIPPQIFEHIWWFTPNQTEAAFFVGDAGSQSNSPDSSATAQLFLARGCGGVVLKMGVNGTYIASKDGGGMAIPAFAVSVVDTTAAGDAFNAGFAVGLMLGKSPEQSARFAAAVAAISVTRAGAQPSMPDLAEVEGFIKHAQSHV